MLRTLLPLWLLFRVLVLPRKSRKRREITDLRTNSESVNCWMQGWLLPAPEDARHGCFYEWLLSVRKQASVLSRGWTRSVGSYPVGLLCIQHFFQEETCGRKTLLVLTSVLMSQLIQMGVCDSGLFSYPISPTVKLTRLGLPISASKIGHEDNCVSPGEVSDMSP